MVHRLKVIKRIPPAVLLQLWREQHPGASAQLVLDFNRARDSSNIYPHQLWEISAE